MKIFRRFLFAYYWTKGEKSMRNGDYETANKCKIKLAKFR